MGRKRGKGRRPKSRNPKTEYGDQTKTTVYIHGGEGFDGQQDTNLEEDHLLQHSDEGFDGRLDINLPEGHHLPHEIVYMILFFLPASSLTEFRCVCKTWLSAITNPEFIAAHRKRTRLYPSVTPTFVFSVPRVRHSYEFEVPELHFYGCGYGTSTKFLLNEYIQKNSELCKDFNIGTINGLLFLYSRNSTCIFNPFTKDIFTLSNSCHLHLAYNVKYSIGFVADPTTGTYNIVRLVMQNYNDKIIARCDIYTQGSPDWREADCSIPSVGLLSSDPVSMKGILYWRTYDDLSILSFDLTYGENGEFTLFPIPSHISFNFTLFTKLEALQESLCLVECGGSNVVTIWKLEEGGENEWSKWYSIEIQIPQLPKWGSVRVLAIYEGKLWLATNTELFSYDSMRERLVNILDSNSQKDSNTLYAEDYMLGVVYTETMASAL